MATFSISPTSGIFGTTITLTGLGFLANTTITITYKSVDQLPDGINATGTGVVVTPTVPAIITTDSSGDFSATMTPINHVWDDNTITVTDGTTTKTATFTLIREPEYCSASDVADWLRITINKNTDPNTTMINDYIISNEDEMDNITLHTYLKERQVTEIFDVNRVWDWGRGLPIYPRHHNLKPFDKTKGDKVEIWNSNGWVDQSTMRIFFEEVKGVIYIRGYLFTILTKMRFRITYRYGGTFENQQIPKDIKRCCVLMTAMNILETDFQMSQIAYGGEGNVDKDKIMTRWQLSIDRILQRRSDILTIW